MSGNRSVDVHFACPGRKWKAWNLKFYWLPHQLLQPQKLDIRKTKKNSLLPFLFRNKKTFTSLATTINNWKIMRIFS